MPDSNPTSVSPSEGTSWLTPESYWYPRHWVITAWYEHAPFASWLMTVLRPAVLVELGTHAGFSFFVFAEAAKRLGLSTELYALDTWRGDDQAGFYSEQVFESVSAIVASDYPHSAHLVRGFFDESVGQFADGSIDLLHVDGRHGYDDVKKDFETYRQKLSDRAVVLFHDTHEFQEGFGVHRFWKELAAEHPSFMFEHGHGLGVLAIGASAPTDILRFIEEANAETDLVRATYFGLGRAVGEVYERLFSDEATIAQLREELVQGQAALNSEVARAGAEQDRLEGVIADRAEHITGLGLHLRGLQNQLDELHASTSWKVTAPLRSVTDRLRRR